MKKVLIAAAISVSVLSMPLMADCRIDFTVINKSGETVLVKNAKLSSGKKARGKWRGKSSDIVWNNDGYVLRDGHQGTVSKNMDTNQKCSRHNYREKVRVTYQCKDESRNYAATNDLLKWRANGREAEATLIIKSCTGSNNFWIHD